MTKNIWLAFTTVVLVVFILLCVYFKCGIKEPKPVAVDTIQDVVHAMFDDIGKTKVKKPIVKQKTKKQKEPTYIEMISNKSLHFKSNSFLIENTTVLDDIIKILTKNTSISLTITGHTDSDGSTQYNKDLAQRRADTVKNYIIKGGIDKSRITTQSQGEQSPLVENINDKNKATNRRVQFEGAKI
jgi:outer membrane protein OmpA-like peptidoglycan-associated protein